MSLCKIIQYKFEMVLLWHNFDVLTLRYTDLTHHFMFISAGVPVSGTLTHLPKYTFSNKTYLTHRGPVELRKWAIFNTILMSPKSWLSQEDLDAGCEHSMVPMDS